MKANYAEAKKAIDAMLENFDGTMFFDYLDIRLTDKYGRLMNTEGAPTNYSGYPAESIRDFLYYTSEDFGDMAFAHGSSRVVMWDCGSCDYVMKIGCLREDEKYNEKEEQVYVDAKMNGAADAFAWMTCIYEPGYEIRPGVYLDRGIYAMEFADCDNEVISEKTSSAMWEDYCDDFGLDPQDSDAYERFMDEYGEEMAYNDERVLDYAVQREWSDELGTKVMDIIRKNKLSDFHESNFGFMDGHFVITDYAGWK